MKNNKFISYGRQSIDREDIKSVLAVLQSDFLTQGPKVEEFEKALAKYTGAKYAVAVSSGTAALHLAVAALGIEKNREGITSPNTFLASANCLVYNGLKPVFADIDSNTYCIDPQEVKKKITSKTKVIIPVHFAGQPAEIRQIHQIAKEKELFIIEDAAHAIGSRYEDGDKVGSCKYSDMTIFSFHPVKTITTGEGGAITTNSKKIYNKLLMLRSHGITKNPKLMAQCPGPWYYEMQDIGFNYRLTDLQAALGTSQLKKLDQFVTKRREIVKFYNLSLKAESVITPCERPGVESAFHLYVVLIDYQRINRSRSQVMNELAKSGIGTQVHYIPVHLHPYYQKKFHYKVGDYPIAESYYNRTLSLPLFPSLKKSETIHIIKFFKKLINE